MDKGFGPRRSPSCKTIEGNEHEYIILLQKRLKEQEKRLENAEIIYREMKQRIKDLEMEVKGLKG